MNHFTRFIFTVEKGTKKIILKYSKVSLIRNLVNFYQKVQKVKFDDEETFDRYYTEDFKTKMNSVKR